MSPMMPRTAEEAVQRFLVKDDSEAAIRFLRANSSEVTEFCLLVQESYPESDVATAVRQIALPVTKLL